MVRNLEELGPTLQKIVDRLMSDDELVKLLYYTDKDPYNNNSLTKEEKKTEIFEKLIKIVPRVGPKETAQSILSLKVDKAINNSNSEFIDIKFSIEVFVPLTQWIIKDANLRPFAIMGRIKKDLSGKTVDTIGKIQGGNFELSFLTEEISCYEMKFSITNYD